MLYGIPNLDSTKLKVSVKAGMARQVTIESFLTKEIRIIVKDETGAVIPDAFLSFVTRREIALDAPHPENFSVVFTPLGASCSYAIRGQAATTDQNGSARLRLCNQGPGQIYVSATKPGHVGEGFDLWDGVGVPNQAEFVVILKRAAPSSVTLKVRGEPLCECNQITVTDLKPTSVLGQIKYPTFTSNSRGRVNFEQLKPGHEYAIMATSSEGTFSKQVIWRPNVDIELQ